MSVIFEGIEMPKACCFVDGEHTPFAHFEYCKQRETIETNFRPNDCPVKPMNQEMISNNELGVECISREQAKVAIRDKFKDIPSRVEINTILNELPSLTPIRLKGHWIWELDETPSTPISPYELNYAGWVCSCCHEFPDDICEWDNPDEPPTYKFCPNCGAEIESEDKE